MHVSRPYKCAQVVWVGDPRDTCGLLGLMESGCPSRSGSLASSRRFLSQGSARSTTWSWADVALRAVRPCCPPWRCCPRCSATLRTGTCLGDRCTSLGLSPPAREGALSPCRCQLPAARARLLRSGWRRRHPPPQPVRYSPHSSELVPLQGSSGVL